MRTKTGILLLSVGAVLILAAGGEAPGAAGRDWPAYGGGPEGIRYSALTQINRSNVRQLAVAWTYDTMEEGSASETQPIVIGGVLYGVTPTHKVIALDAANGTLLWKFDSGMTGRGPNRGVAYWASWSDRRIFAAVRSYVYALDAKTGMPIRSFG